MKIIVQQRPKEFDLTDIQMAELKKVATGETVYSTSANLDILDSLGSLVSVGYGNGSDERYRLTEVGELVYKKLESIAAYKGIATSIVEAYELFPVGTTVNVKHIYPDDLFEHDFTGRVVEINSSYVVVEDQEEQRYDVAPEQLRFNSDEIMNG